MEQVRAAILVELDAELERGPTPWDAARRFLANESVDRAALADVLAIACGAALAERDWLRVRHIYPVMCLAPHSSFAPIARALLHLKDDSFENHDLYRLLVDADRGEAVVAARAWLASPPDWDDAGNVGKTMLHELAGMRSADADALVRETCQHVDEILRSTALELRVRSARMADETALMARRDALLRGDPDPADWIELGATAFVVNLPLDVTLDALDRALRVSPDHPAAHFWRARCFFFEHYDLDRAREHLRRMLAVDPGASHGWGLLGGVQLDAGEPIATVLQTCERAWQLAPCWLSNVHAVCDAAVRAGRHDLARARLDAGLHAFDRSGLGDLTARGPLGSYCLDVLVGRHRAATVSLLRGITRA